VEHTSVLDIFVTMLGLSVLLTSALAGGLAAAGYVPESARDPHFQLNLSKRAGNGSAFHGPYSTKGRDIVDSRGEKVSWAGVNWPMSGAFLPTAGV
jgi:endoglucanase